MSSDIAPDEGIESLAEASEAVERTDAENAADSEDQPDEQNEMEPDDSEATAATNQPKPIVYNLNISPVVRCVKIVCRIINLDIELR